MLREHTIQPPAQPTIARNTDPVQKLEAARDRVRVALRTVATCEGRLLDFDSAEEITRILSRALRDMEELKMHLMVTERIKR